MEWSGRDEAHPGRGEVGDGRHSLILQDADIGSTQTRPRKEVCAYLSYYPGEAKLLAGRSTGEKLKYNR
jgi:hypothetical protein